MKKKIILAFVIFTFVFSFRVGVSFSADSTVNEILNLNDEIQRQKDKIEELNKQIEKYQRLIRDKQKESATLNNQISIINNQIDKLNLEIQSTETEIEKLKLEIDSLDLQIKEIKNTIATDKQLLEKVINFLNKEETKSDFEIVFLYNSFSEFFDHLFYIETLQKELSAKIKEIKDLKNNLENQNINLTTKKSTLETLRTKLRENKARMQDQLFAKNYLLEKAKSSEAQFRKMVEELRKEQEQTNQEIVNLEATFRKKLEESDKSFANLGQGIILSWPVEPKKGISAYFHDPDYPFRYIYEHPAIDIRASYGTQVAAAAGGFVVKVIEPRYGNLSYIMLMHRGGFSTIYMHLSQTLVKEGDFIDRGQIIGKSGGIPGTPGAGRLTTGPHLHFEVRLNGIPVDPMQYLIPY
jgi:murein DD-endopeptidase MepM/ murein hydrolase activator NlpD